MRTIKDEMECRRAREEVARATVEMEISEREKKMCSVAKSRNKSSKDVHHLEQMRIRMALRDHQGQKVFVEKTRVWEHFKE